MTTRVLGLTEMTENQQGKFITFNEALHAIDAFVGVKSASNGGPPGGPAQGDAYIVDVVSGDWSGFAVNDIAFYYLNSAGTAAWINIAPSTAGPRVYIEDTSNTLLWNGAAWVYYASNMASDDEAGTTYTLVMADANKRKRFTSGSATTVTVPTNASVAFPLDTEIVLRRAGTGSLSVTTTSLTINGTISHAAQHDSVMIKKVAADTWDVYTA